MKTVTVSSKRQITLSKTDLEYLGIDIGRKLLLRRGPENLILEVANTRGVSFERIMEDTRKLVTKKINLLGLIMSF